MMLNTPPFRSFAAAAGAALLLTLALPGQVRPTGLLRGMTPIEGDQEMRTTPVVRAVRKAADSVVNVVIQGRGRTLSQGSGVIIDPQGLVITNWHVIVPASDGRVVVQLRDERSFGASVLSTSPDDDLALLLLDVPDEGADLLAVEVADSDNLMIGETVIAIGNPQGKGHTVTAGVLSAADRVIDVRTPDGRVRKYEGLLQTDAAINQGNSGGALLDIFGRLVGINNAMAVGVENIGFAIPVNTVRRVFREQLLGSIQETLLGLGLAQQEDAVVIDRVEKNSSGALAGLQPGDRIVAIDGEPIATTVDYSRRTQRAYGGRLTLEIERDGERLEINARALSRYGIYLERKLGAVLVELSAAENADLLRKVSLAYAETLGLRSAQMLPSVLRVTELAEDGVAAEGGWQEGDLIVAFDRLEYRGFISRRAELRLRPLEGVADFAARVSGIAGALENARSLNLPTVVIYRESDDDASETGIYDGTVDIRN